MRNLIVTGIIIILCAISVQGQKLSSKKFQMAEKGYISAMQSDNPGLAEDAVFCVLIMYARYPDNNYTVLENQLKELAFNGKNSMIQIKAYLACQSLKSRSWISAAESDMQDHDPNGVFALLTDHFSEKMLTVATSK